MKKILALVMVVAICVTLCACAPASTPAAKRERISSDELTRAVANAVTSEIRSQYNDLPLDFSKTEYEIETVEDLGESWHVSGSYDLYWANGDFLSDHWFGVTVNAYTGSIEDITVFGH